MWLAWCLFVSTWGLYLFAAALTARDAGRKAVAVLFAFSVSLVGFSGAYHLLDVSLRETLWTLSALAALMLVITRGRPSRMFDPKAPDFTDDQANEERIAFRRKKRSAFVHQAAFLVIALALLFWHEFMNVGVLG